MFVPALKTVALTLLAGSAMAALAPSSVAQTAHGIAATVNEDVITTYDLRQRVLFNLMAAGTQPDEATLQRMQMQALRSLVDERIQMQEAKKFDLSIPDAEVERSVARLAQSNNMSVAEISAQMARIGINLNTLRDQVRAEVSWQRIINGRFGNRIRISDTQIDETINRIAANVDKPSYLLSEIFIEATPDIGGIDGAIEGGRAMVEQIEKGAPFTALARQFSSSATAAKGGDMGWIREGELRSEIDNAIKQMEKGKISTPIQVPGGVYVIALRDKRVSTAEAVYTLKQVRVSAENPAALETAKTQIAALALTSVTCETLEDDDTDINVDNVEFGDLGEVKANEVSDEILTVLGKTDVGKISAPIELSGGVMALMVCDRQVRGSEIPTRDAVEDRLIDQQLAQQSKRYLRDLRRNATIEAR